MTTGRINQVATDRATRRSAADGCSHVGPIQSMGEAHSFVRPTYGTPTRVVPIQHALLGCRAPECLLPFAFTLPVSGREQQDGQERNFVTQPTEYRSQRVTRSRLAVDHCVSACATSARPRTIDANATTTSCRSTDALGPHPRVHGQRFRSIADLQRNGRFPQHAATTADSCAYR